MPSVLAVFAHPDDIEFVAAGTLIRLHQLGWQIHYMNVANGCCGSTITNREETANIREAESRRSASLIDAAYYPPLCNDLEVEYNAQNLARLVAVIRRAQPTILLTHAPVDYMEDHMQTCRLAVSAAFARAVPNFASIPAVTVWEGDVAIYHAQPHGNQTPLCEPVVPQLAIPIDSVLAIKRSMLEQHVSQQDWLKSTQGLNSYCQTMLDLGRDVASLSGADCEYAEGWRRHLHLGFGPPSWDPLAEAMGL
jgi:LmbE family N-acetylglucosaminyl deacetylase